MKTGKKKKADSIVFDTSAIHTYFQDEPGADRVEHCLKRARDSKLTLYCSFVTMTEIWYTTAQAFNQTMAKNIHVLVNELPIQWVHSDDAVCLRAAHFKATHKVSLADAYIAATAAITDSLLIHKDPEFESLCAEIKLEALPYKKAAQKKQGFF